MLPGWLEVDQARKNAVRFFAAAKMNKVEAKTVMSVHEIENPFTWGQGIPSVMAARKPMGEMFLVLFEKVSGAEQGANKALVSADCKANLLRVVGQQTYERYLEQSGYDVLGKKLPPWDAAGYDDMLAVMLTQAAVPAGQSMFFGIACRWEQYARPENAAA